MKKGSTGLRCLAFPQMGLSGVKTQEARKEGWREGGCPGLALGRLNPDPQPCPLRYLHTNWSLIQCLAC